MRNKFLSEQLWELRPSSEEFPATTYAQLRSFPLNWIIKLFTTTIIQVGSRPSRTEAIAKGRQENGEEEQVYLFIQSIN